MKKLAMTLVLCGVGLLVYGLLNFDPIMRRNIRWVSQRVIRHVQSTRGHLMSALR